MYVLHDKNMVVAFTSSLPVGKEGDLLKLLNDYIVPAVQAEQPLPAAAQAAGQLSSSIRNYAFSV